MAVQVGQDLFFSNQLIDFNYVYKCNETELINEKGKWHFATRYGLWVLSLSSYLTVPIVCQIQFPFPLGVLFNSLKASALICGQSCASLGSCSSCRSDKLAHYRLIVVHSDMH